MFIIQTPREKQWNISIELGLFWSQDLKKLPLLQGASLWAVSNPMLKMGAFREVITGYSQSSSSIWRFPARHGGSSIAGSGKPPNFEPWDFHGLKTIPFCVPWPWKAPNRWRKCDEEFEAPSAIPQICACRRPPRTANKRLHPGTANCWGSIVSMTPRAAERFFPWRQWMMRGPCFMALITSASLGFKRQSPTISAGLLVMATFALASGDQCSYQDFDSASCTYKVVPPQLRLLVYNPNN